MAQDIGRLEGIAEYNRIPILVEIGNEICTEKRRRNILIYDKV